MEQKREGIVRYIAEEIVSRENGGESVNDELKPEDEIS